MNKRIRILFTTSNFNTAGSSKVIYDLIQGLDKTKFDIEIACGNNQGEFFKTVEALGVPIHVFQTKTKYKPYMILPFRLYRISKFFKKNDYDIIHSWQWSSDWTEALSAKLVGVKWIYTKKAMGFESKHWKFKSYLAEFIVTINDEMRDYFPNKEKQQLIPLGIDTDYYSSQHFPLIEASKTIRIITVANLVSVKGIEVLLQAVHNLKDPNIFLTILGDNENSYGIKMKSLSRELGLEQQVSFLGKHSDVRPFIAASNLYVIPTLDQGRKEGMPMALVEAMSMGIPVFGSNISGIRYVLKNFQNLLFKAGDAKELEQLISNFKGLTFEERKTIGSELRAYCVAHFTLQSFINSHEYLYFQLLKDSF